MAFCLDANILIQAHRATYPMDVAPGFWAAIESAAEGKRVFIIDEIYRELKLGEDDLFKWVHARREILVRDNDDADTQRCFPDVAMAARARMPKYPEHAIASFLDDGDPWVIAYARAHAHVIVTEEKLAPARRSKVQIPDVCVALSLQPIKTLDLLRQLGVRLVLG